MKKFIALMTATVLIVSMIGVGTALAGCDIDGKTSVYAGSTYTYTGNASYTCSSLLGKISGLGKEATFNKDNGDQMGNVSLSGKASISVKIPSDAAIGTEYTITFSGSYSVDDADGIPKPHNFSCTKTITVVQKPVSTPRPATSSTTNAVTLTGWALAAAEVPGIEQGGAYNIEVTDDTTVPAEVLLSLQERQGMLNVNFGTYTCTIDGAALGTIPEDLTGINLAMSLDTDETFSQVLGGVDVYQLHFSHEGALPGKFTYRFQAMANQPGDIVYLYYYYDASGVVEAKQECVVDDEGYITVNIYHCSSYFISATLIEGAAGIIAQPEPVIEPEPTVEVEPTQAPVATPQAEVSKPAEITEDSNLTVSAISPVEQWFGVPYAPLIAALAAAVLLSMLLTMLFTRSGLFKRRPKAAETAGYFAPDLEDIPPSDHVEDLPPSDTVEDTPTNDNDEEE